MLQDSGEMEVKRIIAFRDTPPSGLDGLPCGTCRETLMEFSSNNKDTEIMVNYDKRETTTLEELFPNWWGGIKTK
jgi:Cytidine deaminase